MIDYADKSYLAQPLPTSHEDKRAAAHQYLRRRRISILLPKAKCKLDYVPSEGGSRVLTQFRNRTIRAAG